MKTLKTLCGPNVVEAKACKTIQDAIDHAAKQEGRGYIWVYHRNHYHLVGNYKDHQVWNGPHQQIVEATSDDLNYIATH